jgi:2-isopropylmalate synthase
MAMLKNPGIKYRPFPQVDLPDRQWPSRTITKAPRWLSTDMRDGNQSLIDPMDADKKARSSTCWSRSASRKSKSASQRGRDRI